MEFAYGKDGKNNEKDHWSPMRQKQLVHTHKLSWLAAFFFASGQLPVDPATGKMVEGDIQTQFHQLMKMLQRY